MKQYDRIWVPDDNGDYEVCDVEYITPEKGRLSPESNVIVVTIDQLRELWDTGRDAQQDFVDFTYETYLKSKGINI